MLRLAETKFRYVEKPSLAVLGQKLSKRFGLPISIVATADGLEFTVDGTLEEGDREKIDDLMEKWGYLAE